MKERMEKLKKYFYRGVYWLVNQYYRVKSYVFWGEFERKHFLFQKEGSKIRILLQDHEGFVEDTQKAIDGYKHKKDERKYIEYALGQALKGCTYIVISKGKKFVQYWTSRGRLDFDFPIRKGNGNGKYYYQVIGLLATMDFVSDSLVTSNLFSYNGSKPNKTYKIETAGNTVTITGYFNKMSPEAGVFTMKMFEEIYKEKRGKLEIRVG
ncbi:MAG: hypothetical protein ACD_61C00282G0011 [uncultured bacterium]|nr:MAG: hypothetical protein ACD_61C00282G0011 [uncultured bacterium]